MASTRIDEGNVLASLKVAIQAELVRAAEPVIQEALRKIETEMRRKVAEVVLLQLESGYSAQCRDSVLEIRVDLGRSR